MKPAKASDEAARLEALRAYQVLDTPPEQAFDDLAHLASQICGTPAALVSLVDAERQWFKAKVGIAATETPRDISFCAHAILQRDLLIVRDALADERFAKNPLVTSEPNIRFYAGAPLVTPEGLALGTLCVVDHVPRELTPEQQQALRALSRMVITQLELRRELRQLASAISERRRAEDELDHLFHLSLDLICIAGTDGSFKRLNPAWEQTLGFTNEELLAKPYFDFVHPDDRAATLAESEKLAEGAPSVLFENRYRCRDGSYKWLMWNATPGKDGLIYAAARDITERKRAERRLAAGFAVTAVLAEETTLSAATPRILRAICDSLDWEFGAIWRVDEKDAD